MFRAKVLLPFFPHGPPFSSPTALASLLEKEEAEEEEQEEDSSLVPSEAREVIGVSSLDMGGKADENKQELKKE
jgi:hypothetical protein